ncbi:class I SAM-dependent methyltransferase [Pseudorhodoplanes sp.]|uniref:class I SAM-dependent methyltransferase n=1 Tax=Pseudorhodoplanes sp. TaxID=1934341 RepID=UPI00391D8C44
MTTARQSHWQNVYATKGEGEVSWFQESPKPSLDLIELTGVGRDAGIVDIGGGASRLSDALLDLGFVDITVLDLSDAALARSRARLGARAAKVQWIVADVTSWQPDRQYDIWHDRAAFHFLTDPSDQRAYVACLKYALRPGGYAIIGTFAPDGPEKCSGLPVMRHDHTSVGALLGDAFSLIDVRAHAHETPWGATQAFQFSTFRRRT